MQITRMKLLVMAIAMAVALSARAQKIEAGVLGGGYIPLGSTFDFSPGFAVQGVFAYRLFSVPFVGIYAELPVVAGFSLTARSALSSADYSSLFVTPGLKLKLVPGFLLSPYFVVGGGYARFHTNNAATGNSTSNNGAVDIGGGLDIKVFPFVSLRGEVRDFHTSSPTLLGLTGITGHNLVGAGGVVVRF
jgi:hypothetical protein